MLMRCTIKTTIASVNIIFVKCFGFHWCRVVRVLFAIKFYLKKNDEIGK